MTALQSDARLLQRIQDAELRALADTFGETAVQPFGGLSLVSTGTESSGANRIAGVSPKTLDTLDQALEALPEGDDRPWPCRIDVLPGAVDASVADALFSRRFRHTGFESLMVGSPGDSELDPNPGIEVVEPTQDWAFREFVQVFHDGFEIPAPDRRESSDLEHWSKGASLFLARLYGTPVSAGMLHEGEHGAFLLTCASTHVLRRQGGHQALVQHRLGHAAERGHDRVFARVPFDGPAQRNLVRGGLRIAATIAVWSRG